jgi:hypothetical protein
MKLQMILLACLFLTGCPSDRPLSGDPVNTYGRISVPAGDNSEYLVPVLIVGFAVAGTVSGKLRMR